MDGARYILFVEQDRRDAYLGNSIAFVTSKGLVCHEHLALQRGKILEFRGMQVHFMDSKGLRNGSFQFFSHGMVFSPCHVRRRDPVDSPRPKTCTSYRTSWRKVAPPDRQICGRGLTSIALLSASLALCRTKLMCRATELVACL